MNPKRKAQQSTTNALMKERRAKVFEMKKAGATYEQIATALSVSKRTVHDDIHAVLNELHEYTTANGKAVIELQLARLEEAILSLNKQIKSGNLGAIDRLVKIIETQNKMLGLNAPVSTAMDVTTQGNAISAWQTIVMQTRGDEKGDSDDVG